MVGAGAVVTKSVPPNAVVIGNPAVIVGYQTEGPVVALQGPATSDSLPSQAGSHISLGFEHCDLWRLPHFADMRGDLVAFDFSKDLPFAPRRAFLVYAVSNHRVRGEHAHRSCHQLLVAAHGRLSVVVDNGQGKRIEINLDSPTVGLHLPPMVWSIQYKFDPLTVLLVYASETYDPGDYIRDYDDFLDLVKRGNPDVGNHD
jgi:hypothetical protein